mmetsp:Transcript_26656/g.68670  ORF Transcript_26656/g.68670 Transcript_26656/m.68670 type:complete len:1313 (+) Transcript_26656:1912-5850(+)
MCATDGYQVASHATCSAIEWLQRSQFILWDSSTRTWAATGMGRATSASGLDPHDALLIRQDMARASHSLILPNVTDLHICYLCVPANYKDIRIDWKTYHVLLLNLRGPTARVVELIGVKAGFVQKRWLGNIPESKLSGMYSEDERVSRKLFIALILQDLINEVPPAQIHEKYKVDLPGIRGLQDTCAKTAGMVSRFALEMGWEDLAYLTSKFQGRINLGIKSECTGLTQLTGVKGHRARLLFKAGVKTPEAIVACGVARLAEILSAAGTVNLHGKTEGSAEYKAACTILKSALEYCEGKAKTLQEEAKELLALRRTEDTAEPEPASQNAQSLAAVADEQDGWDVEEEEDEMAGRAEGEAVTCCGNPAAAAATGDSMCRGGAASSEEGQQIQRRDSEYRGGASSAVGAGSGMQVFGQAKEQEGGMSSGCGIPSARGIREGVGLSGKLERDSTDRGSKQPCPQTPSNDARKRPRLDSGSSSSGVGMAGQGCAEGSLQKSLSSGRVEGAEGLKHMPHPTLQLQQQQQQQQQQGGILISTPAELRTLAASIKQAGSFGFVLLFAPPGRSSATDKMLPMPGMSGKASAQRPEGRVAAASVGAEGIAGPHRATEVEGVGISVGGRSCCYYVQLSAQKAGRQDHEWAAAAAAAGSNASRVTDAGSSMLGGSDDSLTYANRTREEMRSLLRELLMDPKVFKVTYRLKEQLTALNSPQLSSSPTAASPHPIAIATTEQAQLRSSNTTTTTVPLDVDAPVMDMLVASWILNPCANKDCYCGGLSGRKSDSKRLSELILRHVGKTAQVEAQACLACPPAGAPSWRGKQQMEVMVQAVLAHRLYMGTVQEIVRSGMMGPLMDIEMKLVRVLSSMESWGIQVNLKILLEQQPSLSKRLQQISRSVDKLAGKSVNLGSPQDVSKLLYQDLGIPVPTSAERTKSGYIRCRQPELLDMRGSHRVVPLILEHRSLEKQLGLLQGLVEGICQSDRSARLSQAAFEGSSRGDLPSSCFVRMHGTFLQAGTDTGRLAMTEPSLHVVPRPIEYDLAVPGSEVGTSNSPKDHMHTVSLNIRAAFVAPPGHVFLSVDYKQLELRIMAHLSGEPDLCAVFQKEEVDPFHLMVCFWLGCNMDQVTKAQRERAKRLTYGLIYGMGLQRLANELDMAKDVEQVACWKESFLSAVPGLVGAIHWTKTTLREQFRKTGMVTTLAGRRRKFSALVSSNRDARNAAERSALSTLTQGSGADLIKHAMVRLQAILEGPKWAGAAKLILMIHDELIYEVHEDWVSKVAPVLKDVMEKAWRLRVPTPVNIKIGPSWGDMRQYPSAA